MNLITSETLPIFWAGGSQVKITADGIFITTNGKFEVKAQEHIFKGAAKVPITIPLLPEVQNTSVQYRFVDDEGVPYSKVKYIAYYENGREVHGITDEEGYSQEFFSTKEQTIKVILDI